jgi:glycerol uptake facilitator-like aquaporin
MGTYLLVFTVLHAAVHSKWAVLVAHLVLVPFTGCGINPARSFGPMIVDTIGGLASNVWIRGWWVFYTAPFVG